MSPIKQSLLLVLHHGVLLLLTGCCEGQSHMIGPTQPVVAMVGDDIILPCHLEPAVNAVELTVEWSRNDLKPRFVYVRRNDVELLTEQNSLYTRRTSLSLSKLQRGDISLNLSSVQLSDAGTYKCLVPSFGAESVMELTVGSVSSPVIKLSTVKNKMMLECKSKDWYPEPQLLWLNSDGKFISAEPTNTVRGSNGCYTVSSKVSVEKGHSYSFTCRVQQQNISQIKEARIHVSDDLFMFQSNTAVHIAINLVVCLISVGTITSLIWRREQKKTETTRHNEDDREKRMEEHLLREGEEKEGLDDELKNHTEHLEHVNQIITNLQKQKNQLKDQREKLNSLQQEDISEMKEVAMKLKEIPKTEADKKMKKREQWRDDLETRRKVHEELLKITDSLMEATENDLLLMTTWKVKLENDKKNILKQLKEKQKNKQAESNNSLKEEGNNEQVSVETR